MRHLHTRNLLGTLLVLLVVSVPAVALGGDSLCESTQAANDLRSCCICREVKRILSDPALEGATVEVLPLRIGATVRMEAPSDEGRVLLQEFVERMWGDSPVDDGEMVCDYCRKRRQSLEHVMVDWTTTADGLELVLISDEPEFAQWVAHDAQETRTWVLGSAGY